MNSSNICILCKGGKNLCGNKSCPLLSKINISPKIKLSDEFFGPSSSIFVGRSGYPNVSIGPVGNMSLETSSENASEWFGMDYSKIVEMRSLTLRSKKIENVKSKMKFTEDNRMLAMSRRPIDVEIKFKSIPKINFSFSDVSNPMGPSGDLINLKITDNLKIPQEAEYIISDDLNSIEQTSLLYKKFDVYYAENVLSSGALGKEERRKMVPTRWAITAVDDIISKDMLNEIRTFSPIQDFEVYESEYLGNHFVILLMPGKWEFENFEAWAPGSFWAQSLNECFLSGEYEPFEGRKNYADEQTGGYYAVRFSICEFLKKIKKQARVIGFREIDSKYVVPLGVWVCRETVRNAFKNNPTKFSTLKEAMNYVASRIKLPIENYTKKSRILSQKRIFDFM